MACLMTVRACRACWTRSVTCSMAAVECAAGFGSVLKGLRRTWYFSQTYGPEV